MPHSSLAIANEFIRRAGADRRPITQMQVQKLLYLAHGWHLAIHKRPLLEDRFEAWEYGPVLRRLHTALTRYGRSPITRPIDFGDDTPFTVEAGREAVADLSSDERALLDQIWARYGKYEAFQLSALTHESDSPWHDTYARGRNRVISDDAIGRFFADMGRQAA